MLARVKCLILCSGNIPNEDPLCPDIFRSGEGGECQPNYRVRFLFIFDSRKTWRKCHKELKGVNGHLTNIEKEIAFTVKVNHQIYIKPQIGANYIMIFFRLFFHNKWKRKILIFDSNITHHPGYTGSVKLFHNMLFKGK